MLGILSQYRKFQQIVPAFHCTRAASGEFQEVVSNNSDNDAPQQCHECAGALAEYRGVLSELPERPSPISGSSGGNEDTSRSAPMSGIPYYRRALPAEQNNRRPRLTSPRLQGPFEVDRDAHSKKACGASQRVNGAE